MLKMHTGFPLRGILAGVGISALNIAMSNYRRFEATGKLSSIFKMKNFGSRGSKVMLLNLLAISLCASIDYFYINNFSGLEVNHLSFLQWCKANRISECQLEFEGQDLRAYQQLRFDDLKYHTLSNANPIDHYTKILEMSSHE